MLSLRLLGTGGETDTVVANVIEECSPFSSEGIGDFGGEATREDTGVLPFFDVLAPALDEVTGEFIAQVAALIFVIAERGELRAQQGEEIVEGVVVARMRCGGKQDQVAILIRSEFLQQLEAELFPLTHCRAGVGLIHDNAFWRDGEEVLAVTLAFDVIEADDDERVLIKEADTGW